MNCREYIIEFEERGDLSEPARLHLTVCAECKKASERQTQIWLLIEDFQPVAAPTDFDFHVKARIANAKPSDFQKPSFLPILRYVLPLSVVVLLLGVFVFNAGYFSNSPNEPQVAQTDTALPLNVALNQMAFAPPAEQNTNVEMAVSNANSLISTNGAKQPRDTRNAGTKSENESPRPPESRTKDEAGGGSREFALSKSNVRTPLGINLNVNTASAPQVEPPKSLGDDGILGFLGIQTILQNGKHTVKSLTKDYPAERSGVKIGDVVEKADISSVTVTRGTEKLEITMR